MAQTSLTHQAYQDFPKLDAPIVDSQGFLTFAWYRLIIRMWHACGLSQTAWDSTSYLTASSVATNSVTVYGLGPAGTFVPIGDVPIPGSSAANQITFDTLMVETPHPPSAGLDLGVLAFLTPQDSPSAIPDGTVLSNITGAAAPAAANTLTTVFDHDLGSINGEVATRVGGSWTASTVTGITEVGTISVGTWEGTKVNLAYGGTDADLSSTGPGVLQQASLGATVTVGAVPAASMLALPQNDVYQGNASNQPAAVTMTAALTASPGVTGSGSVVLATAPTVSSLTVTTAFTATGLVTNADLANDSMTIAGHVVVLGGTQAIAAADLSNGTTGTGAIVLASSPALTTPNIGAATGTSLSVTGQLTSTVATGTAPLVVSSTTRVANLNAATAGNADTVTTNANLTGPITSVGNVTSIASQTGTGTKFVVNTGPTINGLTITGASQMTGTSTFHVYSATDWTPNFGGNTGQAVLGVSTGGNQSNWGWARFTNGTAAPVWFFGKSRGTPTVAGAVVSGDDIMQMLFYGDDGSTPGELVVQGAQMALFVDGAVATSIVPMRFAWYTMNTGGTFAERMRLNSSGGLSLGTTTDPGSGNMLVNGTVTANTAGSNLGDQIDSMITTATATSWTSNTTLSAITGLSSTVVAGKTYRVRLYLNVTAGASGGIKVQFSGSHTNTSFSGTWWWYAGTTLVAVTNSTSVIMGETAAITAVVFEGIAVINAGGNFTMIAAQNASNATTTTVNAGSYLDLKRIN